ncbi:MAG: dTMP kinase [Alphaproteobacteria bacterium]
MATTVDPTAARRGRFVTFEGVDGAGKSTQIRLLAERLRVLDVTVVLSREPGGSPGAEAVRRLLLEAPPGRWDALSEALLVYAARRDHVLEVIRPALGRGAWVLCDRFADSSRAYQGRAGGVPETVLDMLDDTVLEGLKPDLTLILDLPVRTGLARVEAREPGGRFEAKGEAFQERVREGFRELAHREPGRCRLIDAAPPPDQVAREVWKEVAPLLEDQGGPETPQ